VIVKNYTKINKTNNHWPQVTEHKNETTTYGVGNPCLGLEQAQISDGFEFESVNVIPILSPLFFYTYEMLTDVPFMFGNVQRNFLRNHVFDRISNNNLYYTSHTFFYINVIAIKILFP
jgi:hypothetical protein